MASTSSKSSVLPSKSLAAKKVVKKASTKVEKVSEATQVKKIETKETKRYRELISQIEKRDGRIAPFSFEKIVSATHKAMIAANEGTLEDAELVAHQVAGELARFAKKYKNFLPTVEGIQDSIEKQLMLNDFTETAKAYILYRDKRNQMRAEQVEVPQEVRDLAEKSKKYFNGNSLGEFVYLRTYAKWLPEAGRRETWIETVDRYIDFMRENLGKKLSDKEYAEIREAILSQKVMPSMRLMQFAGDAARRSNVTAYNCSYIAPSKVEDFAEIMYISMCGTGVGYSVESANIQALPQIAYQTKEKLSTHVVADSKEGWCDALTLGLKTWYGGKDVDFDFSQIRPAGSRLATMGGKASGPEPLRNLLAFARERILSRQGRRLRNIDAHDVICKIGDCVVAGGVRRSAMISLSDLDDDLVRDAKKGQFWMTEPQRALANNSAVYNEKPSNEEFMDEWVALVKSKAGERGIFNRGGLMGQLPKRRIDFWKESGYVKNERVVGPAGTNPCVTKDTWVMTTEGARQVEELIDQPFEALVDGKVYPSEGFFKTGDKQVFEIKTDRGFSFKATDNHKVLVSEYRSRKVSRNIWKQVKDLTVNDEVILHNHSNVQWSGKGTKSEGWLLGNLYGDGNIEKNQKANLDYWGVTQEFMMQRAVSLVHATVGARSDLVGHVAKTGYARVGSTALGALARDYGMTNESKWPAVNVEKTSADFYEGFLQGWFDADGSVQGTQKKGVSVRLASSTLSSLVTAQRMLARLGIISSIYENRRVEAERQMPDGKGGQAAYFCQANHELIVSGANLSSFAVRIGFSDPEKMEKLNTLLSKYQRVLNREKFSARIATISPLSIEDVYDCTVPGIHAFDGNGVYLHNCGEIILKSKQFCNLSEVVARADDTKETLVEKARLATILGTYQSSLSNLGYLSKEWSKNCEEERLLGVSITGQWDSKAVRSADILEAMRAETIKTNKKYAERFGINQSTAITCVKPSGTVSQTLGVASGMHPRHSPYYIRRIRISATDSLFKMLRDQGVPYHPEVGQTEDTASTFVLEFPVKSPDGAINKDDLTALDQLEHWQLVKEHFTEHNPSVTISVGDDEWIKVANWVYEHWDIVGGLSFLPRSNHVYQLAPYEEISKDQYEEMAKRFKNVDYGKLYAYERVDDTDLKRELACVSGTCEI
jgi:intein-encoded DNA endonuclease-like protein